MSLAAIEKNWKKVALFLIFFRYFFYIFLHFVFFSRSIHIGLEHLLGLAHMCKREIPLILIDNACPSSSFSTAHCHRCYTSPTPTHTPARPLDITYLFCFIFFLHEFFNIFFQFFLLKSFEWLVVQWIIRFDIQAYTTYLYAQRNCEKHVMIRIRNCTIRPVLHGSISILFSTSTPFR